MAAQTVYDLRKRNLSQVTTTPTPKLNSSDHSTEETASHIDTLGEGDPPSAVNLKQSIKVKEIPVIEMTAFETVNMDDKLNLLMSAINKVNTNFHLQLEAMQKSMVDQVKKVDPRIGALESLNQELTARVDEPEGQCAGFKDICNRMDMVEWENSKLKDNIATLKGFIQVHDKAITSNKGKIIDLTTHSMANNVIISGIPESNEEKENCKAIILEFLEQKLQLAVPLNQVEVAHCMGKKSPQAKYSHSIIARCSIDLKECIFKATHLLKDVKNCHGDYYQVRTQLPEPLLSKKIEREDKLRAIRKANAQIPEEEKHRRVAAHIQDKTLYIKKVPQWQHIFPPTIQEVLSLSQQEREALDKINMVHTMVTTEKHSHFRGHAVRVNSSKDVKAAYQKLRLLYPDSDHIMMAYTVKHYTGHHDHGASRKMLQILSNRCTHNAALFVTREYGGVQLGPRRFMFIETVAHEALNLLENQPN